MSSDLVVMPFVIPVKRPFSVFVANFLVWMNEICRECVCSIVINEKKKKKVFNKTSESKSTGTFLKPQGSK